MVPLLSERENHAAKSNARLLRTPMILWLAAHLSLICGIKAAAKLNDSPAISLRRPSGRQLLKLPHRAALGCRLQPQFPAGVGLTIKRLCGGSGAAHITKKQDFNGEVPARRADVQHVSDAHVAGRLHGLPVRLNPAKLASVRGQGTCLKKPRGPEPFVDSDRSHEYILLQDSGAEGNM